MRCVRSMGIHICVALAVGFTAGCSDSPSGYALQARGGTYVDGTGRLGLAVLATARDDGGEGPGAEWTGALSGPMGVAGGPLTYGSPGAGSWSAAWWPAEPPYAGTYSLSLGPAAGDALSARFDLDEGSGLAPAKPFVSEDGTALTWAAVPGAAAYECRITGESGVVLRRVETGEGCDVGALAPGAYTASVLAYSADVAALGRSGARTPPLPDRFDVSEARLAFALPGSNTAPALIDAAGGGFSDGTGWTGPGLAIWVSLRNPDGSATSTDWTVAVVGPGLDAAAPLTFTYPAHFPRILVWNGAVPAVPGSYGVVASSGDARVARPFTIGALGALGAPAGVTATDGAQGSAKVSWTAVPGASSYLVTARAHASQAFVMNQWVAGTDASFPAGTFAAGETYDVRVAATDADMVGGAVPAQLAITEDSYQPASFVAR